MREGHETTQAGLIVAVILERPTCLVCLASKVGMTNLEVVRAIDRIASTVRVTAPQGERCRVCGSTVGPVYSVARPE